MVSLALQSLFLIGITCGPRGMPHVLGYDATSGMTATKVSCVQFLEELFKDCEFRALQRVYEIKMLDLERVR